MAIKGRGRIATRKPNGAGKLLEIMAMRHIPQALHAVAVLGIADLLADGARNTDDLAQALGSHRDSLYRLMRLLSRAGIFAEDKAGRFRLTPLGLPLRSEAADSVRAVCIFYGGDNNLEGLLVDCVRSGKTARELISGSANWMDYHERSPASVRIFNAAMTALSNAHYTGVIGAYKFASIRKLVDVGGGHGRLLSMILKAHPRMRGVLFDLANTLVGAQRAIAEAGLKDRCEIVSGDFFQSVPTGGDAYILSRVIHDWDDEKAVAILKVVRKAIAPRGRLLLFEAMIKPGTRLAYPLLSDLNMMIRTGGRERSQAEYLSIYQTAGFKLTRAVATASPTGITIIEGRPV